MAGEPARPRRADARENEHAIAARAFLEREVNQLPKPRPRAELAPQTQTNLLYWADNLTVLRERIPTGTIDLVYLDPPFKSSRQYNTFFEDESGRTSDAQQVAFEDTWHWGPTPELHYMEITNSAAHGGRVPEEVASIIASLRHGLGTNQLMAYLVEMTVRLLELHRVLKPTGSLFIHCDPTASHYLKVILDAIFETRNFVNEIVWKRSDAHNDFGQGAKHLGRIHDTILFYRRTEKAQFNPIYTPLSKSTAEKWYRHVEPETGRRFNLADITGPGGAAKGNPKYEFLGVTRYWRYSRKRMQELYDAGLIVQSKPGAVPAQKRYLDASKGVALQDMWTDIEMLRGLRKGARVGYPTEKPLALLRRIIEIASSPGDIVLDPFCGCGTAVVAARELERRWIGIDITRFAILVMRRRLGGDVPVEGGFTEVSGIKEYLEERPENRYQFQWWALDQLGAAPVGNARKKGPDHGVDGVLTFTEAGGQLKSVIVSVKSGHAGVGAVRELVGTTTREHAPIGVLVTLDEPTREMVNEANSAGLYRSEIWGRDYPRLQIITAQDLLDGARAKIPRAAVSARPKKRRDNTTDQTTMVFDNP